MKLPNGLKEAESRPDSGKMAWKEESGEDAGDLQKQRREKKPFFYCRLIAKYPASTFTATLSCHILVFMIAGSLFASGFELFPTNFDKLPMELYSIPYRLRDNSWQDRNTYSDLFSRTLTDTGFPTFERGLYESRATVTFYYDAKGGNIFTAANFRKMKEIEDNLASVSGYSSYCMTYNTSLACKPFKSILRYFDGTFKDIDPVFNDPTFSNIPAVLHAANTNANTSVDFEYFLSKGYSIDALSATGRMTRSEMLIGCSLSGSSKCGLKSEWKDTTQNFLTGEVKDKLENYLDTSQFDFYYYSYYLWIYDVMIQAMKDMLCAVGSMLFIFLFMLFHTRSLFITALAVMSIFASFIGTEIIYVGVVGFKYFGFFHILSIFIILGIGADDIFVFYDTWRLTAYSSYPSLAHRLSDAYSKSVLSMFITSLTTCVAFFSSAISPLLATRSFGVFSGILILYNYLSVIIYFPTVVVMYHRKFENWTWPCCRRCIKRGDIEEKPSMNDSGKESTISSVEDDMKKENIYIIEDKTGICNGAFQKDNEIHKSERDMMQENNVKNMIKNEENNTDSSKVKVANGIHSQTECESKHTKKKSVKHQKKLVIFFRDYYFKFVTHKIARWVILPVFAIFVIVFAYQASKLEPDNEQLKIFKDSHRYTKSVNAQLYRFVQSGSSNLVTIYIAWGLGLKDRSGCHFSSIDCDGTQVYDDTFDPNPVANQQALKDFCDTLYSLSAAELSDYKIKLDSNGNGEISCFTRDMETYLKSLPQDTTQGGSLDLSLPWNTSTMLDFMSAQSTHYNSSLFTSTYPHVLTIPLQHWMYKGYTDTYTPDYGEYNTMFGEQKSSYSQQLLSDSSIYYGNSMKYIGVRINTTVNIQTTGYSTGIPLIEKWENFINNQMAKMPVGVNKGYQLTRMAWHWIYVQKTLADNAVLGIIIGICLAFPILTLATMNVVIGFCATLSICCTTTCVIGVIPSAGWKLGLLVSLNMCLVVGLAVDYVVHLAEGYHLSLHKDRLNRTRDMLEEMGMSVFSGACTTLGASTFMFLSQVQFFLQFGIFLFCTIGFSILFSLGLFTVLMGLIGPQNEFGDLRVLLRWCKSKCGKGRKVQQSQQNIQ